MTTHNYSTIVVPISAVIADPATDDLSSPALTRERVGSAERLLWRDEAESPAGRNYLNYLQGGAVRTGARLCHIGKTPLAEANKFYSLTHLQGGCNGHLHYGLYSGDHLVACMSFNTPTACRSKGAHFLLQRYASQGVVAGGAARLLQYFRQRHGGSIITFSDNRYSPHGRLYAMLGFTLSHTLPPDYRYWRGGQWFSKQSCQRRQLIRQGAVGDTEREMAESLGYRRVYDLGKRAWHLEE